MGLVPHQRLVGLKFLDRLAAPAGLNSLVTPVGLGFLEFPVAPVGQEAQERSRPLELPR